MRRALFLLVPAALAAAGCGGRAATKPLPPSTVSAADAAPVKARAAAADASLDKATGVPSSPKRVEDFTRKLETPTGDAAPESAAPKTGDLAERRGRVLGTDPDGCTWLEGDAAVVVGGDASKTQARASAVAQAEAGAVQDFLGVDINSRMIDFQQEGLRKEARLTESLLQTTRNGRIIKEQVLEEGYRDIAANGGTPACPSCLYRVKLKACVIPRDASADKDFRVEVQVSQARYFAGDEATITVSATRDCTVYLYDVYDLGAQNKTALVVPNEAVPSKTLKAGETWTYPSEEDKKRGVHLVAELAGPDQDISAEVIRVIAAKTPLRKSLYDPADGGYLGVFSRLHRARVEWVDDVAGYTILKK